VTDTARTFQEQLAALREVYSRGLPDKLERIELAWQEILDTRQDGCVQSSREDAWERLHRGVHSLAGSGASLGFPELSVAARELEVYMQGKWRAAQAPGGFLARQRWNRSPCC
jgi:HPt (histidine-containing phosphotransfer) domain-containing protein